MESVVAVAAAEEAEEVEATFSGSLPMVVIVALMVQNHDDVDCDGDAGGDCDAAVRTAADAGIAVGVADDAHPASHYGDPQTNTSAVRSGYRS